MFRVALLLVVVVAACCWRSESKGPFGSSNRAVEVIEVMASVLALAF